jgi:hypothetical protein
MNISIILRFTFLEHILTLIELNSSLFNFFMNNGYWILLGQVSFYLNTYYLFVFSRSEIAISFANF